MPLGARRLTMVMFVFPLVRHSRAGRTLHKAKVKYSGFRFGGSHVSLKVREAVCVPGDPAIMCPCLFKGARFLSVLARLAYPIVSCGLIL